MGRMTRLTVHELRSRGIDADYAPVLRQRRRVADQTTLNRAGRAMNLSHALDVRERYLPLYAHSTVLVVDDVVTTGATLVEAVRALTVAGAHVAGGAVVAATRRRGARQDGLR
jgi:predicted amidophosphoribosyltransferase